MKKAIIIIVITLFWVSAANAQKSVNYVSFANSNNDTLQYLKNNFENQKTKYIGQPLSKIFNDLELKILDLFPINRVAPGMTGMDKRNIAGISLSFYNPSEYKRKTYEDRQYMKLYSVTIYTTTLLLRSEYKTISSINNLNLDTDVKALYSGNNYVVADIEVTPYVNTPQTRIFTKSDCGMGGVGSTFPITVPAGTYISTFSQADADERALVFLNAYRQEYANELGTCTYTFFASKAMTYVGFRKNNCPGSKPGSMVYFSAVEGAFTSTISHQDADAKAQAAGQAFANANGICY